MRESVTVHMAAPTGPVDAPTRANLVNLLAGEPPCASGLRCWRSSSAPTG